jgi:hypothetical protein
MKKFSIVLVALVAILVLPGAAKADSFSYSGASGNANIFGGSGTFSTSSLGGSQSFSFTDFLFVNTIKIGSGASAFNGQFTSGFTKTGTGFNFGNCFFGCSIYTASVTGTGASAGESGTITFELDAFGNIVGGSSTLSTSNVPEPGTLGMFAIGLAGLGLMLGRKIKVAQVSA